MTDTVFALASGAGRAGIAVVRVSGPAAGSTLAALSRRTLPPARRACLVALRDPDSHDLLDNALVLWFPAPSSITGEDVVELHLHGGRAVIAAVTSVLMRNPDIRPAEPGEFSRRAFLNGKLDLTEAEAVADLVDAETEAQRRQALRQMSGELGRLYEEWRGRLIGALAHIEADIDFPDEDLPADVASGVQHSLIALIEEIRDHLGDGRRGEWLREGIPVAVLGPPNAGKSSLVNRLARRDAAIVTSIAGTTRDVIDVYLDVGGYPVILADTAGIRESVDGSIEAEGVRRALARGREAAVTLLVFDGGTWPRLDREVLSLADARCLVVLNKADRGAGGWPDRIGDWETMTLSALTGQGIDRLTDRLSERIGQLFDAPESAALTRARYRRELEVCVMALDRAIVGGAPELVAEDVRLAVRAIGRITGVVDVDDVLDIVFRDFCIGK